MTSEWPELTGTDKQIQWATQIRTAMITNLRAELASVPGTPEQIDRLTDIYAAIALRQTDAAWWISQVRDAAGSATIYDVPRKPAARLAQLRTPEDLAAIAALRP